MGILVNKNIKHSEIINSNGSISYIAYREIEKPQWVKELEERVSKGEVIVVKSIGDEQL